MNELDFLKKYVNTPSPSGFELILGGQEVWIDYVREFTHQIETDLYGNAYAFYNKFDSDKKTILLDAHADEIGFLVHDISDDGFISVVRLGGSDILITPATRVDIWVRKGKSIPGIFGHPAIHVQDKYKVDINEIFIDVGVSSRKEVEKMGIEIGTPITMQDGYFDIPNFYCGRSLDDKIGGFIHSQILRRLYENKRDLPFNLVIVNAIQEEVGLFGAQLACEYVKPDIALVIDVTHDTTSPAYDRKKQGHIVAGEGCVLMSAPPIQKNLLNILKDTAKENDIKYQIATSGRGTGTNADSYAYPHGIPTALIKMGMRYMHTTVETVHKDDVKATTNLLYNVLIGDKILTNLSY